MSVIDQPSTQTPPPPPANDDGPRGLIGSLLFALGVLGILAIMLALIALAFVALIRDDSGGDAGGSASALDVSLSEFAIEGELSAPAGDVTLNIVNAGAIEHNLAVRELDVQSNNMQSRGVDTLALGELEAGSYELYCSISGHAESGMTAELVIGEADSFEPAELGDEHAGLSAEEMDQLMVDSMLAFPAETEGLGNQLLEPEILADGTKRFELTAEVIPWEVSPDEFVEAWAYNGQVPGPQIRVDIGDKVEVELTNLTPMGTDIHWHGVHTPNDQDGVSPYTQDPVATGETFTYNFVAEDPAIGMYHAHLHSQTSVINGMFAAFQIGDNPLPYGQTVAGVEIPADLEPAFEEPMVLNDAGTIGLTLNGKSFPATEPIVIDEGEWGVIHYYNEGLTAHPMHLHQFPQLVYAKDGIPLDSPYWADTVNVAPGERYSVLFQADAVGTWVYHCHILTHVERADGMFGMVTAMVVNPKE
ncbi:multicopper oxidase domain-containing protein [Ilumatobacter nonamiensis]|uniref:multicopper oxidase domain-containing protein n=1 Tax=Ilumatobacter nonamiensis TaxID=467093 RepID=UPI00034A5302|nr:multicopper oxidase domain-containing protein [Ilumatobacter nonamiensis]